ncbi:DUF4384 domain-containing protein [Candidatus Uabimicrobium amorphum]|uniref:DUF4384 domain-containing protein n=1 Tax=Uabimicrobium amorphum TaxID=2596890 RepID=A0A5S9IRE1_UABAM|nr:DUF4384 domain-containing protein [Candidatus Uabimicrobium amorphum]BBM86514.1 hypothetical protein UABAM_04900 [Candidatus Uabimicrobium amorphum]
MRTLPLLIVCLLIFGCRNDRTATGSHIERWQAKNEISQMLQQCVREMQVLRSEYHQNAQDYVLALGNFSFVHTLGVNEAPYEGEVHLLSEFSEFLHAELTKALTKSSYFQLEEERTKAEGVLLGSYFLLKDKIRLNLSIYDKTGKTYQEDYKKELDLPIPSNTQVIPANYKMAGKVKELGYRKDFGIHSWTKRKNLYREGEEISLFFKSDEDCYVKIYHISTKGEVRLVYQQNQQKIRSGVEHEIPQKILGRLPSGVGAFKVVATLQGFAKQETLSEVSYIDRFTPQDFLNGQAKIAQKNIFYTIIP